MRRSSTVVIDEYGKVITAYTIKQGETRKYEYRIE